MRSVSSLAGTPATAAAAHGCSRMPQTHVRPAAITRTGRIIWPAKRYRACRTARGPLVDPQERIAEVQDDFDVAVGQDALRLRRETGRAGQAPIAFHPPVKLTGGRELLVA